MNKAELIELLRSVDEITLIELLEIDTDELIDVFLDKIDENQGKLIKYINDQ